ncbi:helix-turn-helix transcriptional regulator [Brevibacillus laterosporus]|uniref:helix-turn-helix domain-containing protein n=1 Tax=Brevibacillus laterosporus TaxID=1465 RepID=UPI003D254CDE
MLAYRIKMARLNKGWTQGKLGEKLGKTRTAVVNWETGYATPEDSTISEIAKVLKVEREWLIDTSNDECEKMEIHFKKDKVKTAMSNSEKIGARLRYFRERRGLTGEQVAASLNIARGTLSGYETGRREPNFETLILLSKLYAMSIDQLLECNMTDDVSFSVESEPWIFEVLAANQGKKNAIKKIWETIRDL